MSSVIKAIQDAMAADRPTNQGSLVRNLLTTANLAALDDSAAGAVAEHLRMLGESDPEGAREAWRSLAAAPGADSSSLMRGALGHPDPQVRAVAWAVAGSAAGDTRRRWLDERSEEVRLAAVVAGHIDVDTIVDAWVPASLELLDAVATARAGAHDLSNVPDVVWLSMLDLVDDALAPGNERADVVAQAITVLPQVCQHVLADPQARPDLLLLACLSPFATDEGLVRALALLKGVTPTPMMFELLRLVETRAELEGWDDPERGVQQLRNELLKCWHTKLADTLPVSRLPASFQPRVKALLKAASESELLFAVATTPSRNAQHRETRAAHAVSHQHMSPAVYRLLAAHPKQAQDQLRDYVAGAASSRWVWSDVDLVTEFLCMFDVRSPLAGTLSLSAPDSDEPDWVAFETAVADGTVKLPPHVWSMSLPWTALAAEHVPAGVALTGRLGSPDLSAAVLALLGPVFTDPRGVALLTARAYDDATTVGQLVNAFAAATGT